MDTETIAWFIIGFTAIILLLVLLVVIMGSIGLWALNTLGFLQPFEWTKAIAIGILITLISEGVKSR